MNRSQSQTKLFAFALLLAFLSASTPSLAAPKAPLGRVSSLKAGLSIPAQPDLGRFLVRDPIRYQAGMNLYTYCGGNPVNFTDPSGLQPDRPPLGNSGDYRVHIEQLDSGKITFFVEARLYGKSPADVNVYFRALGTRGANTRALRIDRYSPRSTTAITDVNLAQFGVMKPGEVKDEMGFFIQPDQYIDLETERSKFDTIQLEFSGSGNFPNGPSRPFQGREGYRYDINIGEYGQAEKATRVYPRPSNN